MPAGFLLAEDAAVKARFSNIAVSDDRNGQRIAKVFFRYPEGETEKEYPFITIEMIDLVHDTTRQLSEHYYYYGTTASASSQSNFLNYYPSTYTEQDLADLDPGTGFFRIDFPVPVILVYQITTFARSALHDRQLTSKILRRVMPFRRGFIDIPEDGTIRRFDLAGWTTADLLDQEAGFKKRIFRKVFTVQMTAEIPTNDLKAIPRVEDVIGIIKNKNQETTNSNPDPNISEEF